MTKSVKVNNGIEKGHLYVPNFVGLECQVIGGNPGENRVLIDSFFSGGYYGMHTDILCRSAFDTWG